MTLEVEMFRTTTFALALCLGLAVSAEAKSGKEVVQLNVREPVSYTHLRAHET